MRSIRKQTTSPHPTIRSYECANGFASHKVIFLYATVLQCTSGRIDMNIFQFVIICKRTNNANNATQYVKLGKKRRESSKRNYHIISPRVLIKVRSSSWACGGEAHCAEAAARHQGKSKGGGGLRAYITKIREFVEYISRFQEFISRIFLGPNFFPSIIWT